MTPLLARLKTHVRLKLLALALLPIAVLLPIFLGVTMWHWIGRLDDLLIAKVTSDLRIAEQYFLKIEEAQAQSIVAVGDSRQLAQAMGEGEDALNRYLADAQSSMGLDFLIMDALGPQTNVPDAVRELLEASAAPSLSGLIVATPSELDRLGEGLSERARLSIVPTSGARPLEREHEDRGLILWAAYKIEGADGYLFGGRLLNRNLDVIDRMNALIYGAGSETPSGAGTTTLFLDDVRISTNVRLFEGDRALGTRVTEVVWHQVVEQGQPWLDRAFVVNDWYVSGYMPLTDVTGQRVGMLYTGFLEKPFADQRNGTVVALGLAFLAVLCLAAPLFLRMAREVFAPLERMTSTMKQVEDGNLSARIGTVEAEDEIGAVARHLDRLLDQVKERDEALRDYADHLNDLVDQRTQELREANQKLEDTYAQLILKEKLASLGEITAGVAHEINNPIAVIQGNMELLRLGLSDEIKSEVETELDLIETQTRRINTIVGKLLSFSRSGEMSDHSSLVNVSEAVDSALVLVAADLRQHKIETRRIESDVPLIEIVENELQQVLVNLFINAAQAMSKGGTLTVEVKPLAQGGKDGVAILVHDTGPGIPAAQIDHVFDPFFTTKQAEGTGLGLSISQALIERAGGNITVESMCGRGTSFSVWCPVASFCPDEE
ncbi:sensor histidine kinase [Celeribacter halophilus]|uniref:histidine kinase n=1 Tax=Celeribacter halophilus TaxID=576117 RepID=A0A1I3QVA6_9RHOB|nr:cache domain-containing protein [Celeribacter halophilus]PZX13310.1 two-component system NtrC family sensor kinase [Celeribacter halophilus]SFJ37046.1 two-component system, NtrC family, sensor kinase [Celeribacter halophilus]